MVEENEGSSGSSVEVPKPVVVAEDAVTRLFQQGYREKPETPYLKIKGEAREALARMPDGKKGIVLGSGDKTRSWREKGWSTLDILPESEADYIDNVNYLDNRLRPDTQDFILAEHITFDPAGDRYAVPGRLLKQANKALRPEGILILQTASFENEPETTIPTREKFARTLTRHGFQTVVEVHPYEEYDEKSDKRVQKVAYYAKKVAEGYDRARITE